MTERADFDAFFAGEFQRRLELASIPGVADASWDRKAAWLLFLAEGRSSPPQPKPQPKSVFD